MIKTWRERYLLSTPLLLIFMVLAACGFLPSDPTAVIYYGNLTGERVSVFEDESREPSFTLAPREEKRYTVLVDDNVDWRMKAEARNSIGETVFCGLYSYRELESLDWVVEIVDGEQSCPLISYRNSTGETITVYSSGFIGPLAVLHPGEVANRPTHVSGNRIYGMRVEAVDPDGTLVFCREYPYSEFQGQDWVVDIVAGENNCPPPGRFEIKKSLPTGQE